MATGDILACRIASAAAHNGWVAEIDIDNLATGGTYAMGLGADANPSTAKIVFTLTSTGYDATGAGTTLSRTVYGTHEVRKPYPNHASSDEAVVSTTLTVRVALSEFIYDPDTSITVDIASGFYTKTAVPNNAASALSVTNNSTLAYPKVIGHFAVEQRRPVNGTVAVEVFAVQKFGKNAKPCAAVIVTATGATSSHVESATVTSMTLSARGDLIPVYAASLDISTGAGFTRGELVNVNFTAYPWVGDSGAILDATADAGSSIFNLGPLKWTVMDTMIAVVDSGGNDTTGVASTTQGTADASPCLTISGALTKIAAQNNSSYSLNRCDGGEVQCKAGTYKTGKYAAQAVTNGYFTIKPHSSTNRAGVIFDDYVTTQYQYAYQRYYNVTINRSGTFLAFAANTNVLVMESVNFVDSGGAWYSGDTNTNVEFLDCTTVITKMSPGGNDGHSRLNRNCTWSSPTGSFRTVGNCSCVLGADVTGTDTYFWDGLETTETNIVIAYNKILSKTDDYFINTGTKNIVGMAIVNNLAERIGASSTPMIEISDANNSNVLFWHNSFAGKRVNHENDITASYVNKTITNWSAKYNIFNARGNHRADIFDTDATITGAWSVDYSVGWDGNHNEAISSQGDGDFFGTNSNTPDNVTNYQVPVDANYVADNSRGGADTGNGNYHLDVSSASYAKVVAGLAVLPYDLAGTARSNTGSGSGGVYEMYVSGSSVPVFMNQYRQRRA